jgi:molybdate transport system substrate-binding protein
MRRTAMVVTVALAALVILGLGAGCPGKAPGPGAVTPTDRMTNPLTNATGATGAAATGQKAKLRVYVPCGMIIPFKAVFDAYEKQNPGVDIDGVFDNAIVLAKRIAEKGEKCDVFVSPGTVEIGRLEKAGLMDPAAKKAVGTFDLVCIVQKGNPLGIKAPADLKKCKTISTPDPELNSVGVSGKEALTKEGLWEALKPKCIGTPHAIDSHNMVAGARSDAGIAYRNCPLETNPAKLSKSKVQIAFAFDEKDYTKQQCLVAPLKNTANIEAATRFIEFVTGTEGVKILAAKGMTGCLVDVAARAADAATPAAATSAPTGHEVVDIQAFFPDNADHAPMKKMLLALPAKYPGKVKAQFIDFTKDEGFKKWQDAGLTCGAVLINNEQTWTYEKNGKPVEVTFKMRVGGEWTEADLNAVIAKIIKDKGQ